MIEELSIGAKYYYHNLLSLLMLGVWFIVAIKGSRLTDYNIKYKISIGIIAVCFFQEFIDFINRIFLDSNYFFSIQRDIPLLQFCQISFYFSLLCIFLTRERKDNSSGRYSIKQFLFDSSFLLGFSGAFQGVITPDFLNINNFLGVICIQLQHSLIILNLIWLMVAYGYRLDFRGVCLSYLFINMIAPLAILLNNYLGENVMGVHANYFYVHELPKVDNFFLNFVSDYPSPDYILYIQPIFIIYFLALYLPFFIYEKLRG